MGINRGIVIVYLKMSLNVLSNVRKTCYLKKNTLNLHIIKQLQNLTGSSVTLRVWCMFVEVYVSKPYNDDPYCAWRRGQEEMRRC